ncbi:MULTISPECIES: FHA domain-containing protein [Candidatus Ichthyocystis]|uniref:Putative membrane protein n=1 Tax=Candidatus Ichthyocystis hellenicum TaxID=1561003 RepID=A0A0S4M0G0_9BURK|nr:MULTISPECIES: FHA domain-containing protein [Ichthyocystis]CUT17089.1 putative membrane protein [Candidatus Ichthyocystis hellenicum]
MEKMSHEIRILAGLHAGAKVAVSGSITVGSDSNCDIVLNDPGILPQAAFISIDKSSWSIKLADKNYPLSMSFGDIFWIGIVPISVALSTQIWPKDIPSPEQTKQYSKSDENDEDDDDYDDENLEDTIQEGQAEEQDPGSAISVNSKTANTITKKRLETVIGGIVVALVVLISTGSYLMINHREKLTDRQKNISHMNELEFSVRALIAPEFAKFNLSIEKTDFKKVIVSGYVPERADIHHIERKLSSLARNVVLRIFVISEIEESVQEILKEKFANIRLKDVSLKGVVTLIGFGSDNDLAQVDSSLETTVMGIKSVDHRGVKSGANIAEEFEKEARKLGFDTLSFRYLENNIYVSGSLNSSSMHVWDQLLSELSAKYKTLLSVSAKIVEIPDKQTQHPQNTTPGKYANAIYKTTKDYGAYGIYGVINGANKYIITEGGGRVMVGGRVGNFRLAEINDNEIVLDGPQKLILRR